MGSWSTTAGSLGGFVLDSAPADTDGCNSEATGDNSYLYSDTQTLDHGKCITSKAPRTIHLFLWLFA